MENDRYEGWGKYTPERFIFDMLVRRVDNLDDDHLKDILLIISANVDSEKDYEIRMDMLALVEYLIN